MRSSKPLKLLLGLPFLCSGLLSGCGGGGGGGGSSPDSKIVSASVSVTFPTGFTLPAGGVSLSGGLFGTTPITSNKGMVKAWTAGHELVAVLNSNGNPLMLGWVGSGSNVINSRTTADVLTYFAIEGFAAPDENQESLIAVIGQNSGGAKVATDLNADLTSGKNLGTSGASFGADLKALALTLVSSGKPTAIQQSLTVAKPAAITITPAAPSVQSGVTISPGTGTDSMVATNTFRRRVLLFVDRNDTFNGANPPVTTPAPISVSQMEIAPAVSSVSSGGVVGYLSGTLIKPTATPSIALPAIPSPQFGATYDVFAVGAGTSNAVPPRFDASETTAKQTFLKKSFFLDFFLPVLNRICVSDALNQSQQTPSGLAMLANLMDMAAVNQSSGVTGFVDANFPGSEGQMEDGDFLGATSSVLASLNSSPATLSAVVGYYSSFLQTAMAGNKDFTPNVTSVTAVANWMAQALKNVNVSGLPVSLPQYEGVAQSNEYSSWSITQTNGAVISLTPASATISNTPGTDTANLTASVNFGAAGQPKGSTVHYSWSTPGAHGDMVFPDHTGGTTSEPNSLYDSTEYFADVANVNNNGTDVITLSVSLTQSDGTVKQLGTATSSITVNGTPAGVTWPAFYGLRSSTGTIGKVTGGSWGARITLPGNSVLWPTELNHQTATEFFNVSATGNASLGEVALTNKYAGTNGTEIDAVSGDTISITFFDQDSSNGLPGSNTLSLDQDIHLFSPAGKDLGVMIAKFSSTVGDSQGAFDDGSGGDWVVTKTFKIP